MESNLGFSANCTADCEESYFLSLASTCTAAQTDVEVAGAGSQLFWGDRIDHDA